MKQRVSFTNHTIAKNSSSSFTKMLVKSRQMTRMELLVRGLSCQGKIFFFISICFVKMLAYRPWLKVRNF